MTRWLGSWLGYYSELWKIGLLAALYLGLGALAGYVLAFIVALPIAAALGLGDGGAQGLIVVGALLAAPVVAGSLLRAFRDVEFPERPPSWSRYRMGVPLPLD